jgi:cytochrome P450
MASLAAHPLLTIARGTVLSRGRPRLRARSARGPLGAPFDPFAQATIADRAAAYRRLHAQPGVHAAGRDTFALAGYDDVRAAARAHLGIQLFLGAHLARLEARVVLEELIARASAIALAGPVRGTRNPTVHGPTHLLLRLQPS